MRNVLIYSANMSIQMIASKNIYVYNCIYVLMRIAIANMHVLGKSYCKYFHTCEIL